MKNIVVENWGIIPYREAWERQQRLQYQIQSGERDSTLVFCQHPTVITLGKHEDWHDILVPTHELAANGVDLVEIKRGGHATLHNPGQLVGYPIFRLTDFTPDLHWFLRKIEQCIIETIAEFGIVGGRVEGLTGVWVENERKICAIGFHCSRWVTIHGFALNVANNIGEFAYIVPCGIPDKAVTSVNAELSRGNKENVSVQAIQSICQQKIISHFS